MSTGPNPQPRIGSLCTGAAGLDMAVTAVFGGETVWHAEVDPAASRVLDYRFPDVPNLGDLTAVDWATVPPVDIFAAGYPCQPDSLAGKGLSEDDHRWIWPDIARAVGVLRPRVIVLENVAGHFVRGFRTVLGSLTELGYDARWTLVRASDVGAPHRRERLFVVAADAGDGAGDRQRARTESRQGSAASDSACVGGGTLRADDGQPRWADGPRGTGERTATVAANERRERGGRTRDGWTGSADSGGSAAYTDRDGLQGERRVDVLGRDADRCDSADIAWGAYEPAIRRWERTLGRRSPAPTEPNSRGGQRLSPVFVEWLMGWPAGWVTQVPGISRNDQLKICGNGVVPQQAAHALRLLLAAESVDLREAS